MSIYSNEASENGSEASNSDDDSESSQKKLQSKNKGKGKLTAVADHTSVNERQNIACSTLYVYNFPNEASEEELKTLFSTQQGYRKMLFRNTHTKPICFVEFRDTLSAIEALLNLHGQPQPLYETVKGGIHLSFANNFRQQLTELGIGDSWSDSEPKPLPSEVDSLPPRWGIFVQEKTHRLYYYNSETNVTYWQMPLFSPPYNPPPQMPSIYNGWIPVFDHGYQQWRYVNQETGRVQWEAPLVAPPVTPAYNPPPNRPPLPSEWIPLFDHGYQRWYYANKETGRVQWEAPGVRQIVPKEAAERATVEKSTQEANSKAAVSAKGNFAVVPEKEEISIATLVTGRGDKDEAPEENQYALRVSTTETEGVPSAQEEERAAREEARILREEIQALREEARALREEIRSAQEAKQSTQDEGQTAQEAKTQIVSEAEK
jgi:hypothetical protein